MIDPYLLTLYDSMNCPMLQFPNPLLRVTGARSRALLKKIPSNLATTTAPQRRASKRCWFLTCFD